jgi:hypothetical protein
MEDGFSAFVKAFSASRLCREESKIFEDLLGPEARRFGRLEMEDGVVSLVRRSTPILNLGVQGLGHGEFIDGYSAVPREIFLLDALGS